MLQTDFVRGKRFSVISKQVAGITHCARWVRKTKSLLGVRRGTRSGNVCVVPMMMCTTETWLQREQS